jgi:chromosome segregation ATPase
MNTENETKAAPDVDALNTQVNEAYEASNAAFKEWQRARDRVRDQAEIIAEALAAGNEVHATSIEIYREAKAHLQQVDAEDDRLRAAARSLHAELEAARTADQ